MSTRPKVFATRRVPERVRSELEALFDLTIHDVEAPPSRSELLAGARGQDGVVSMLSDAIDDKFLDAAGEQLRAVANHAVGFDNIDVDACSRRGVIVANTPDVLTAATAELAMTLMLDVTRRVSEGDRRLRAQTPWIWAPTFMLGRTLRGRLLGIIGLGRIGSELARMAEALGMRVAYTRQSGPAGNVPWEFLSFDELVTRADVISIHCPLTPESRHLINAAVLHGMKRSAYLVNTARGPVIDEAALAEALEAGEIAGAALDVFEREPEVHERLLQCENVVLAPHLGSATHETREAMGMLCASALNAVLLEDRVPDNALNPSPTMIRA
ncbi:MAG: D-glycerate dehydrogenase [Gaiellaceae bacterium]